MKIPTLQFLGAKDLRVPYRQGLFFDAITKDVGTPITTYVYENSSHSLSDSVETSIDIVVKSLLFLEEIKEESKSNDKWSNAQYLDKIAIKIGYLYRWEAMLSEEVESYRPPKTAKMFVSAMQAAFQKKDGDKMAKEMR
jgi:hypothetical protein